MMTFFKNKFTIVLVCICLFIIFFELNDVWVENYYYGFLYPIISNVQRFIFGWIPFSLGDVVYLIFILSIIVLLMLFCRNLFRTENKKSFLQKSVVKIIHAMMILFIVFKLLWGLNYSRQGIIQQLHFTLKETNTRTIESFIEQLYFDANNYRKQITDTNLPAISFKQVVDETKKSYSTISVQYPFLKVNHFALKPNLYSGLGNYFGYTGYYNPITGEAQVRTDIPQILTPAIACHEVAHQLGYASEDEANFIAYLLCNHSNNIYFKYAITLELIDYAYKKLMILYLQENNIKNYRFNKFMLDDCASILVKKDRRKIKDFFIRNRKDLSDISSVMYDGYLKMNKEKEGVNSYSNVVDLVLSYEASL